MVDHSFLVVGLILALVFVVGFSFGFLGAYVLLLTRMRNKLIDLLGVSQEDLQDGFRKKKTD